MSYKTEKNEGKHSMKISQPRTVPDIVKQFYGVISQPVHYASLFYTYYYLVEVENIRELRREFEKIRDELWVAFFNYGVYSVGREAHHITDRLEFKIENYDLPMCYFEFVEPSHLSSLSNETWADILDIEWTSLADIEVSFEDKKDYVWESLKKMLKGKGANKKELFTAEIMFSVMLEIPEQWGCEFQEVGEECKVLEEYFSAFSRSTNFLSTCNLLFSLDKWQLPYGGEPWSKICKTLLRRRNTKPTIFVDACWGIQHNSGVWMDKVEQGSSEHLNLLKDVLNDNAEGRLNRVFLKALYYEPSLYKYKEYIK